MEKIEQTVEQNVAVRFKFRMDDGTEFVDAINMPRAQFDAMSQKDLDAAQVDRATKFRDFITAATPTPAPTGPLDPVEAGERIKSLSDESAAIDAQLQSLMARRGEITAELKAVIPTDILEG